MAYLTAFWDGLRERIDVDCPTQVMPRTKIIHVGPKDSVECFCYSVPNFVTSLLFLEIFEIPAVSIAHTVELPHDGLGGVERECRIGHEEIFEVCCMDGAGLALSNSKGRGAGRGVGYSALRASQP